VTSVLPVKALTDSVFFPTETMSGSDTPSVGEPRKHPPEEDEDSDSGRLVIVTDGTLPSSSQPILSNERPPEIPEKKTVSEDFDDILVVTRNSSEATQVRPIQGVPHTWATAPSYGDMGFENVGDSDEQDVLRSQEIRRRLEEAFNRHDEYLRQAREDHLEIQRSNERCRAIMAHQESIWHPNSTPYLADQDYEESQRAQVIFTEEQRAEVDRMVANLKAGEEKLKLEEIQQASQSEDKPPESYLQFTEQSYAELREAGVVFTDRERNVIERTIDLLRTDEEKLRLEDEPQATQPEVKPSISLEALPAIPKPGKSKRCPSCYEDHAIINCRKFLLLKPSQRAHFATTHKLCHRCLDDKSRDHCFQPVHCGWNGCLQAHHPLLHPAPEKIRRVPRKDKTPVKVEAAQGGPKCPICQRDHKIWQCLTFDSMTPTQRRNFVDQIRYCRNCLQSGHSAQQCISRSGFSCLNTDCGKRHHRALHEDEDPEKESREPPSKETRRSSSGQLPIFRGFTPVAIYYPGLRCPAPSADAEKRKPSTETRRSSEQLLQQVIQIDRNKKAVKNTKTTSSVPLSKNNIETMVVKSYGGDVCPICLKYEHEKFSHCAKFRESGVLLREKYAYTFGICKFCLTRGHPEIHCPKRNTPCGVNGCELFHHPYFHRIPYDRNINREENLREHRRAQDQDEIAGPYRPVRTWCGLCHGANHLPPVCDHWGSTPEERIKQADSAGLCHHCLQEFHYISNRCPRQEALCGKDFCPLSHHVLLHTSSTPDLQASVIATRREASGASGVASVTKLIPTRKNKVYNIAVEGNIAAGKSTFIDLFVGDRGDLIHVAKEPIEEWQNCGGHNLLKMVYDDPKKNSFLFQSYHQLTLIKRGRMPTLKPVRILERSLYSSRFCFVTNLYQNGSLTSAERSVLNEGFDYQSKIQTENEKIHAIVYLRTTPDVAYERVQKRGRNEERHITYSYLLALHRLHEDWLIHGFEKSYPKIPLHVIDANTDLADLKVQCDAYRRNILQQLGEP